MDNRQGLSGMSSAMNEMEHAQNTLFVPPLVDERILMQFCRAVQSYAAGPGIHDDAAGKLRDLRARLANLCKLASLCRLAILGQSTAVARVIDEMYCLSVDFPTGPLDEPERMFDDEPDDRVQLAAAIDLFAGAAFVSKGNVDQRDRFIIAIVRAIEDAVAFPVTYNSEAAAYLGEGTGELPRQHAAIVIANAAQRLLDSDQKCAPMVPVDIRRRLEGLARKWMRANPVTEFFEAITGPRVSGTLQGVVPDDARVGDLVTLQLDPSWVGTQQSGDAASQEFLRGVAIMFCPHQPADLVRVLEDKAQTKVPEGARTGPIALVRKGGPALFTDVSYLLDRYALEYPVEWFYTVFSFAPIGEWAYPVAFGAPVIQITQVPETATIAAYTSSGPLAAGQAVDINDTVVIHYSVEPPGSDASFPLTASARGGEVTQIGKPGVLAYRPSTEGNTSIKLAWGTLSVSIPMSVRPSSFPPSERGPSSGSISRAPRRPRSSTRSD